MFKHQKSYHLTPAPLHGVERGDSIRNFFLGLSRDIFRVADVSTNVQVCDATKVQ